MGIVEFLEARIAEDEADARVANEGRLLACSKKDHMVINDAGFMQTFTPSRVLREVAAKRKIVNDHRVGLWYVYTDDDTRACETCGDSTVRWPCATICALAAIYSDHPDFDEEWRP